MFYSAGFLRTIAQDGSLSDGSEGLFQTGKVGVTTYRSFCNKDQTVGTSKSTVN